LFEPEAFSVNLPNKVIPGPTPMPIGDSLSTGGLIGLAVNGIPLINPKSGRSYGDGDIWHYNEVFDGGYDYDNPGKYNSLNGYQYYIIPPKAVNLETFDTGLHSPIIGWSLDGLPIYGPYGYREYNHLGEIVDDQITRIESAWKIRSDLPSGRSNPGGAPTGLFLEDMVVDRNDAGTAGFAGYTGGELTPGGINGKDFNIRYGVTPDSPETPRWFYVQCEDKDGEPMFPYGAGGGTQTFPESYSQFVYNNEFFGTPNDVGGASKVIVTDCGHQYVAKAVVDFIGDGTNAKAYPVMANGVIRNMVVDNPGKNYAWDTTTIEILGDGTGATCEPVVIDGKITGVKMINFGEGYTYATPIIKQIANQDGTFPGQFAELRIPTVAEDPANGIVNDAVVEIVLTNPGSGYTYIEVDIQPAVSPTPPVPYDMGYDAKAEVQLETSNDNSTGNGYVDPNATPILISDIIETLDTDFGLAELNWRYSDGAPVENAWKYSPNYPFAVAEGLLLGQPAQFATQFADPTKLYRAEIDSRQQLCTVTRERWQYCVQLLVSVGSLLIQHSLEYTVSVTVKATS
jgi:hypothetical protein